jgi:type IV pilus assembly protein PilX
MIRHRTPVCRAPRQRGTALVMSLVFLVLLTIIGLTMISTVSLQEMMAGNMKDLNVAFQAAESALRDGEADVFANVSPASGFDASCTNGYCQPAPPGTPYVWMTVDWSDGSTTSRQYGSATGAAPLSYVKSQPRYIIEELLASAAPSAGESLSEASTGKAPTGEYYRVTARGTGGRSDTQVLLQSTFRK